MDMYYVKSDIEYSFFFCMLSMYNSSMQHNIAFIISTLCFVFHFFLLFKIVKWMHIKCSKGYWDTIKCLKYYRICVPIVLSLNGWIFKIRIINLIEKV